MNTRQILIVCISHIIRYSNIDHIKIKRGTISLNTSIDDIHL